MVPALSREERIAESLARAGAGEAALAVVLGSGLSALADALEELRSVPFEAVDGMPRSTVPGHAGRFVLGWLAGVPTLVQQGRVHLYEGRSAGEVTASVRAFARLGIGALLLTNAAGAIEPSWELPALMLVEDHLNLQGVAPLRAREVGRGCPYDPELGAALDAAARAESLELHRGVYAATLGPSYESPAEIRLYGRLGARAVGMSTVAEASAAHVLGLRVAALSCLTNPAAGVAPGRLSHEDVVRAGAAMAERFARLVRRAAPELARAVRRP